MFDMPNNVHYNMHTFSYDGYKKDKKGRLAEYVEEL